MKSMLIIAAAAFAFATPAAAQPAQSHQGHHQGADHSQHQGHGQQSGSSHAQHGQTQHGQTDHSQHANCCGDANGNGRMDCCEGTGAAQRPCCAGHQQHGAQAQRTAPAQPQNR